MAKRIILLSLYSFYDNSEVRSIAGFKNQLPKSSPSSNLFIRGPKDHPLIDDYSHLKPTQQCCNSLALNPTDLLM